MEDIYEVEYALGHSDIWNRLEVFGLGFHKMESAIKYVRSTYDVKGIVNLRLRLKNNSGSISEWDNF